jgi:Apea-like HEPN
VTRTVQTAGLLHHIEWAFPSDTLELSDHIKVCRIEHGPIWKFYEEVCKERGVDDGEPFYYGSYVLLEPDGVTDNVNCGDPFGLLDRVCNVIVLVLAQPVPMCRVLQSEDAFTTCLRTYEVFGYGLQTEFLLTTEGASINSEMGGDIKTAWATASALWEKHQSAGRVNSALTYFYYAWRSPYLDQCCLNLSVCLELLFTPHSQGEASHQISFNVARFLGSSPSEMKAVYLSVRNFYNVRSRIVHGGMPDDDKVLSYEARRIHSAPA